jgi:hypothetical protein
MEDTEKSPEDKGEDQSAGLIINRRYAIVAVVATLIVLGSALRSFLMRAPRERWLFEPPFQSHQLRPLTVGISFFFWGFVLWILFCFYRAARNRYERFLIGASAVGFLLGIIEGFVPSETRVQLEPASIAAYLISFAAAVTLLIKLSSKTETP